MKNLLIIFLYISVGASLSLLLMNYAKISSVKFIGSEFLLGYLGIFLGFAFSIVTYDISVLEKVKESILKDISYSDKDKSETKSRISALHSELSDTVMFVFYAFLIVVVIMIFEVWDIPGIIIDEKKWYSKVQLLNAFKFSIFFLSIYAIYDLLQATMNLNQRAENMKNRNPN